MPIPFHGVIDRWMLNGEGAGAWRHELGVTLPGGQVLADAPWPLGEPGDTATWAELEEQPDGSMFLRVVLHSSATELTEDERGVMSGELAEAWWRIVSR